MSDDITTNATNPNMESDDATQTLHERLLTMGTQWRHQSIPTERLATHIRALATHDHSTLPLHGYPLQKDEFMLTDMPPLPQRQLVTPRRYIISAIAAVVVIALLGGAFLVVARKAPGTRLPAATLTLPSATAAFIKTTEQPFTATAASAANSLPLHSLHMLDAMTGWAQTDQKIVRTTDGGAYWQDVTPPEIAFPIPASQGLLYTARDATTAWVSDGRLIYRTTNAGQTWQPATPPSATDITYLTFVDATHGWAIDFLSNTASGESFNLLRTTDGGASWVHVATSGDPGGLPARGSVNLIFSSPTTGWIGGASLVDNSVYFYVTHDGGTTWKNQTLPHPATPTFRMVTGEPTFFNTQDGVLEANAGNNSASPFMTNTYVTHDGGNSWHMVGTGLQTAQREEASDFSDMAHWRRVSGTNFDELLYTDDNGQHWTTITPGGSFRSIWQIDYTSATIGWAIVYNAPTLLHTTDGGHTWQQINYQVG